jgi:hypothetical protein
MSEEGSFSERTYDRRRARVATAKAEPLVVRF